MLRQSLAASSKSENDAIRAAIAQWRTERLVERTDLEELRRLWREGVEGGSGRVGEIDEIKAEARRRHSQS